MESYQNNLDTFEEFDQKYEMYMKHFEDEIVVL